MNLLLILLVLCLLFGGGYDFGGPAYGGGQHGIAQSSDQVGVDDGTRQGVIFAHGADRTIGDVKITVQV